MSERQPYHRNPGEPEQPSPLPEALADYLKEQEYVCLPHATEQHGTVFVLKLPRVDIEDRTATSRRGTQPPLQRD